MNANRMLLAILFLVTSASLVSGQKSEEQVKKGKAALSSFEYQEALAYFTEAIRLDSKNAEAYYLRGLTHQSLIQPKKAISDQNEAIQINPKFVDAFIARGRAHCMDKDKDKALADVNDALKIDAKSINGISGRAHIYTEFGDFSKAVVDYERVVELDPHPAFAYLALAQILAACSDDSVRDGKKALEYAKKAQKLVSDGTAKHFTSESVAASYAELQQFEDAVKWQKMAIENMPVIWKASAKKRLELYEKEKPFRFKEIIEWYK